jgi:hypothetical protein
MKPENPATCGQFRSLFGKSRVRNRGGSAIYRTAVASLPKID